MEIDLLAFATSMVGLLFPVGLDADYDATVVVREQSTIVDLRIFHQRDRLRLDPNERRKAGADSATTPRSLRDSYFIVRRDLNVVWKVQRATGKVTEKKIPALLGAQLSAELESDRALVGREMRLGYRCEKYEVTYTLRGESLSVNEWVAEDLGIPIAVELPGRGIGELTEIAMRPQAAALFERPDGERSDAGRKSIGSVEATAGPVPTGPTHEVSGQILGHRYTLSAPQSSGRYATVSYEVELSCGGFTGFLATATEGARVPVVLTLMDKDARLNDILLYGNQKPARHRRSVFCTMDDALEEVSHSVAGFFPKVDLESAKGVLEGREIELYIRLQLDVPRLRDVDYNTKTIAVSLVRQGSPREPVGDYHPLTAEILTIMQEQIDILEGADWKRAVLRWCEENLERRKTAIDRWEQLPRTLQKSEEKKIEKGVVYPALRALIKRRCSGADRAFCREERVKRDRCLRW